jgi:hypothetical protein
MAIVTIDMRMLVIVFESIRVVSASRDTSYVPAFVPRLTHVTHAGQRRPSIGSPMAFTMLTSAARLTLLCDGDKSIELNILRTRNFLFTVVKKAFGS